MKTEPVASQMRALRELVGQVVGQSQPFVIDQFEENVFAALIGDWDPMHNDPSWKFDSSWHETIVLGFHALVLVERYLRESGVTPEGADLRTVALGRVRFVSPLPVGKEARCSVHLDSVDTDELGATLHTTLTLMRTDSGSPTMVAQHVCRLGYETPGDRSTAAGPLIDSLPAGKPIERAERHNASFYASVRRRSGEWLGSTPWTTIDRRSANAFRVLIGQALSANHPADDGSRPLLVHQMHLLALRSYFMPQVGLPVLSDEYMAAFNYGLDEARWFDEVPVDTRLRDHVQLLDVTEKQPGRWLVKTKHVLEAEGRKEAVLTADCMSLFALTPGKT